MTPNYYLITDGILYTLGAVFTYVIFGMSQIFRMQYIEYMATSAARLINKFFEYSALLMTGMTLLFISDYHGLFYYLGDLILAAFLIRRFMKSDQLQRSEYLRHYNTSKHKLINRMIMNLIHYPTHHDN
ncbi:hypothetical protein GO755_36750 [Spirosoma sp. HMF4905]|uniref:Uncharacterized protein n=1 Tax=Spirosoma arboris TaxID=2682092 RepID=A0A7K1SP98_9BACT|nr:hypothetical protein [Spirosoma arboris]MVM35625.1 hypothetical protein [Spirosoma arboris]